MTHLLYSVVGFDVLTGYTPRVHFDDETEQIVDLEPVLRGELYGPLREPDLFRQVMLDPKVRTLVRPNGADFDPATLHDWPLVRGEFARRASNW